MQINQETQNKVNKTTILYIIMRDHATTKAKAKEIYKNLSDEKKQSILNNFKLQVK